MEISVKKAILLLLTITSISTLSYQKTFESIEKADCVNASLIAEQEGFESGTSFGTVMLHTAAKVCDAQTKSLSVRDQEVKRSLNLSCGEVTSCKVYGDIVGAQDTFCPNAIAACKLSVSKMFYLKQNAANQL